MKMAKHSSFVERPVSTADGTFMARYSATGLAAVSFPERGKGKPRSRPSGGAAAAGPAQAELHRWHTATERALQQALAGRALGRLPPLDLSAGTAFQRQVWEALRGIPRGQTRSYRQVAEAIGKPRAVRAVGGACGANPIPVLVPCHRVLAAGGGLGGFGGGLAWKQTLLAREGVHPASAR